MQTDSTQLSTSGHMIHNQTQESPVKSYPCSHCTLILKSKVYLFEHLNQEHGFDVDAALRDAGLKSPGTSKAGTDDSSPGNNFECRHCDFKAGSLDVLSGHEKECPKIPDNRKMMGNLMTSENQETNQQEKAAGAKDVSSISSVKPTSKTKCTVNSSKDVKTYKRPLQTITKYLVMTNTGSKPLVKSPESPLLLGNSNETLLLQESPADSSPNSSGVFKVTATSTIDVTRKASHCFLLDDHLSSTDIRPAKAEEKLTETPPNNIGKRTSNSRSKSPPAKKAKSEKGETAVQENANAGKQQPSSKSEFLFEFSDDEEEKRGVNGDMDGTQVYFCKQCDYSDVGVRRVSAHYQNNHPYLRFKAVYIQDPSDQSATYRCLECPVEFISAGNLKKHYAKNHPLAPNIFKMQSSELCLVFKCFLCPFTSDALKTLKEHYEDKHPTHKMDTSLMCCRYSALKYQEAAPSSSTCGKAASSEKLPGISPESARTPCKEVKNSTLPPHPTSKAAEVALYHCSRCEFSHKSVVVMHVHYQKSHPDEAVTIDKIKQFGQVASYKASQMAPAKSPKAVTVIEKSAPEGNISESSKEKVNEAARSQQEESSEASKTPPKSAKTKKTESTKRKRTPSNRRIEKSPGVDSPSCTSSNGLVYCQFCTYSSTNIKSVVGHHNAKHSAEHPADTEEILWYSAQVEKKKLQSKAKAAAKASSSKSKSGKQVVVSGEQELQHAKYEAANASVLTDNVYAHAENLFYCQKCNYGNPSPYGVLNHQGKSHSKLKGSIEQVVEYTALIRDEIEKSKSQAKNLSYSGYLPLPLINKGEVDAFFCHFCNYRHSVLSLVLRHFVKQHRGVKASSERITQYTSMVHAQTQKSRLKTTPSQDVKPASLEKKDKKKKTKKLVKVSTSTLVTASQTERALQCHRCSYSTQNVNVLRRHMWKIHKANRSVAEVLKVCFNQGNLQTGYHCDMCVFSHSKASVVHKHYLEKHPLRKLSLENVSTRLYVSPETCSPKKKKPKTKHSDGISDSNKPDGSSPSQRSGHIDAKPYSCKACSFRGSSMSGLTRHYRAIHPWSVKEDGSVLDVTDSKRLSANKQVEDHVDVPLSFDSYQAPLEFENTPDEPDSSQQSASPKKMQCPYCSASFPTQRGLNTHCGMKHQDIVSESPRHPASRDRNQKEQMQARVHLFKCPHCTYINTNYHGVLTHCQMRHPNLVSRADSLYMDEADLNDWEDCVRSKGSDLKLCGYLCENCPQICASLEKLNKHCQEGHNETAANSEPKKSETDLKPSAVSKKRQPKLKTKAPFLNKVYSMMKCQFCLYHCTTKFALARHLQVRHKSVSVSKVLDSSYKCALCSNIYFKKKRLACHYAKKHGKEAFLKYYAPLYKQKRPAATDSDPENVSEPKSSITADDENRKSVFKCPNCPYVNASHHGMLTHCQMRHPDIVARAGKLQSCEILLSNMIGCTLGKGSNVRGYTCKKCPQIHVSLKKLKQHWQNDHDRTQTAAPKHSVEAKTEKEPVRCSVGSVLEAFSLKNTVPVESSTEAGLSDQLGTPETSESNTMSSPDKKLLYRCSICGYIGSCRKYLNVHYRNTHKLDSFTTSKMLERYNKRRPRYFPESRSEDSAEVKCKMCPDLTFDSSQLLIDHYSTSHRTVDFIVLSKGSRKSTGLYKCALCSKQLNGIRKLCIHVDRHNQIEKRRARAAEKKTASPVTSIVPEPKSIEFCRQDELPMLETVEDLAQWNVTPVETFILPQSPQSSPAKPTEPEQPEPELSEGESTCKQCGRTFMSRKGLRTHERSHAAMAAIKKQNNLSTSALKQDINKYVQYKVGTVRPFLCIFCSYRTTVLGLWRIHFMKKHQSVLLDSGEIENQDEERAGRADDESPRSSEEVNNLSEVDEEPEITERSLYLEPPDVQRQLNHYSMMAGAAAKVTVQETRLLDSVLHCEVCNFSTEHLSSIRRHYLNRHGKKMLRCKDCDFVTGLKKTLEMHMETGHSTSSSKATHQKDLHCPFCLYQTTNKNHMIDHIVLHREERVVPIQVCRPKLSRYLEGIVFRCHKCTFTSGSAENLRLHMMKHDDIKPYKCRLCYFDCTQLSDLEAHLSDKHQVLRNHELVGQISLDQLEARVGQTPEEEEEPLSDLEHHNDNGKDVKIEEFATDCNEVPHKTQARNSEEDNIREKITLEVKKAYQKHGQDGKNGQEEDLSKSHLLDHQYVHTTVQENYEVAEIAFLPNAAKRQEIESIAEDGQDSRVAITQQREEEAEGSSAAFRKLAEKIQAQKPNVKSLKHRTLNIEARVEDDILRQILLLDDDGSTCKIHKKADLDQTVKTEQEVVNNVLNEIQLLDGEGSNASPKKEVNPEATFASAMTNQRHPLTLGPSCGQIRMSHRGILTVSFTNCKEKQVENQKNCEAVRNLCEEMPELGNEYMQEDMKTPGCCKEEDENDHLVQKQNEGDEMIVEQEESRRTDREHQQGEGTKEDESPPVFKGAMTVTDETATEEKQFTCELCGRNLMSSSELERHIIRHGI